MEFSDIFNLGTLIAALVLTLLAVIIYLIVDATKSRFSAPIELNGESKIEINTSSIQMTVSQDKYGGLCFVGKINDKDGFRCIDRLNKNAINVKTVIDLDTGKITQYTGIVLRRTLTFNIIYKLLI